VLEEIARPSSDADKSRHERYLSLIQLLLRRDHDLADTFDDPSPGDLWLERAKVPGALSHRRSVVVANCGHAAVIGKMGGPFARDPAGYHATDPGGW
jgi:hypothetical protein